MIIIHFTPASFGKAFLMFGTLIEIAVILLFQPSFLPLIAFTVGLIFSAIGVTCIWLGHEEQLVEKLPEELHAHTAKPQSQTLLHNVRREKEIDWLGEALNSGDCRYRP